MHSKVRTGQSPDVAATTAIIAILDRTALTALTRFYRVMAAPCLG